MSSCRAVVSIPKICQRCGAQFGCGLSCCWCDEIKISKELRARLQERFNDCLCRGCLEALAQPGELLGNQRPGLPADDPARDSAKHAVEEVDAGTIQIDDVGGRR